MDDLGEVAAVALGVLRQVVRDLVGLDLELVNERCTAHGASDEATGFVDCDRHDSLTFN